MRTGTVTVHVRINAGIFRRFALFDAFRLNSIGGGAQSSGVDKAYRPAGNVDPRLDRVPGGAGPIRDDSAGRAD